MIVALEPRVLLPRVALRQKQPSLKGGGRAKRGGAREERMSLGEKLRHFERIDSPMPQPTGR